MMKRILSIALVLISAVMLMPLDAIAATVQEETLSASMNWYNEHKPETDLYIKTKQDFLGYAALVLEEITFEGKVIHILNDLDFSEDGIDWQSKIGRYYTVSAIIDGHGHTIKGLTYTSSTDTAQKTYSGLLGGKLVAGETVNEKYGVSAGVFNLAFSDCAMTVSGNYAGTLFGSVECGSGNAAFKNVYVDVKITSTSDNVGGLVGYNVNPKLDISNCAVDGSICSSGSGIGGFIGGSGISAAKPANVTISNCGFYGSVSGGTNVASLVGTNGISSNNTQLSIKNVICAGTIEGTNNISLFAGYNGSKNSVTASGVIVSNRVSNVNTEGYEVVSDELLKGNSASSIPPEFVAMQEGYAMPYGVVNFLRGRWTADDKNQKTSSYIGYQEGVSSSSGELELRLSALLHDGTAGASLDGFSAVGFDVCVTRKSDSGALKTWKNSDERITTVYTSAVYDGVSTRASSLGGDYIFVASIVGIRKQVGELVFTIRTFHVDSDGEKVYGDVAVIILDTGSAA